MVEESRPRGRAGQKAWKKAEKKRETKERFRGTDLKKKKKRNKKNNNSTSGLAVGTQRRAN